MVPISRRLGLDWVVGKGVEWREIACSDSIRVCEGTSAMYEVVDA